MQSALTPTNLEVKRRSSASSIKEALLPDSDISHDDAQSVATESDVEEYLEWRTTMMENLRNYSKSSLQAIFQQSIDVTGDILLMHGQIIKNKERIEVNDLFPKLTPILETYKRQSHMLQELLDCDNKTENIENIMQKYEDLGICKITIKEKGEICWNIIGFGTNYVLRNLIGKLLHITQQLFISSQVFNESEALSAVEIQIIMQKIAAVSEFLPYAAEFDTADIFALSYDNEYWKTLQQVVQIKEIAPPEQLRKAFARFVKNVHIAMSMVASGEEQTNKVIKNLAMGFGAVYYFFLSNEAQRQTNLFYSRARKETAFEAWNLMEQKLVAQMMSFTLPFIKYANKVYINRVYDSVTLNSALSALEQGTLNTLAPLPLEKQPDCSKNELINLMNQNRDIKSLSRMSENKIPILILSPRNLKISEQSPLIPQPISGSLEDSDAMTKLLEPVKTSSIQLPDTEEKVTVKDIRHYSISNPLLRFLCFENGKDVNESPIESPGLVNSDFDGIIIHIHGGGFVSMSSSSHQNYTRQWAKMTGRPIFSIDYRLAPEHMYPAGLDDCWQAYNWIINEVPRIYGINPKKIILSGDSAGGNLAVAITILAIKNGIRVPDGLLLPYPALKLNVRCFSPSMILAIDDQMVPYSILRLCMEVYVPKEAQPDKDPLLSPVYTSDEILSKFPPTRIMIGDRDPLHDDSWRLVDKLRKLNRDVLMIVYREMTHGFLGFDVPMGMTETHVCVEEAANLMKELLERD